MQLKMADLTMHKWGDAINITAVLPGQAIPYK